MSILKEIENKDPLKIADDDHPGRKDISKKQFSQGLKELIKKHNLKDKKGPTPPSEFTDGLIESLNNLQD